MCLSVCLCDKGRGWVEEIQRSFQDEGSKSELVVWVGAMMPSLWDVPVSDQGFGVSGSTILMSQQWTEEIYCSIWQFLDGWLGWFFLWVGAPTRGNSLSIRCGASFLFLFHPESLGACPAPAHMWSPIHSHVCLRLCVYGGARKMESERPNCCPWGFLLQALTAGPDYFLPLSPCSSFFSTQFGIGEQVGTVQPYLSPSLGSEIILLLGSFCPQESMNGLWRWSSPCPPQTPITHWQKSFAPSSSMCCFPDTQSSGPYALFHALSTPDPPSTRFSVSLIVASLAGSPPAVWPARSLCWAPSSPVPLFSGINSTQGLATSAAFSTCWGSIRSCGQSAPSSVTLWTLKGHERTRSKTFSLSDGWSGVLPAQKYGGQVIKGQGSWGGGEGIIIVTGRRHTLPDCTILDRTLPLWITQRFTGYLFMYIFCSWRILFLN